MTVQGLGMNLKSINLQFAIRMQILTEEVFQLHISCLSQPFLCKVRPAESLYPDESQQLALLEVGQLSIILGTTTTVSHYIYISTVYYTGPVIEDE